MTKDDFKTSAGIISAALLIGAVIAFFIIAHLYGLFDANAGPLPGKLRAFDPVAALPEVRKFAGKDSKLVSINAWYVKSDGTLDLKAKYKPNVQYTFYRSINEYEKIDEDTPLGAPKIKEGGRYKAEIIGVFIDKPHSTRLTVNGEETTERNPGMTRTISKQYNDAYQDKTIKDPVSFKKIWDKAMESGAPPDAVARIYCTVDGCFFNIENTNFKFKFD